MTKIEKPLTDLTPILNKDDLVGRTITSVAEIGNWPTTLMLKLDDDRYFSVTAVVDSDGDVDLSFRPFDMSCGVDQRDIDAVDASILKNSGFLTEDWAERRAEYAGLIDEHRKATERKNQLKQLRWLQDRLGVPVTPEEEVPL